MRQRARSPPSARRGAPPDDPLVSRPSARPGADFCARRRYARASRDTGVTGRDLRVLMLRSLRWVPGLAALARDTRSAPGGKQAGGQRRSSRSLLLSRARVLLRRRLVHHALELHAVGVGEIDRVVGGLVILAGRIDHGHAVLGEEGAERVDVLAARKLERVVVEADVALTIFVRLAFRVGGGDPEQRLAVAPAGHVGILVLELEAEKAKQLAVEFLRAGEVADAEHQVIDADDARHARLSPPWAPAAAHAGAAGGRARAGAIGLGFAVRPRAHLVQGRLARPLASFAFDARAVRHDLVGERDPLLVDRGLVRLARGAGRRSAGRDRDRLGGAIVDHRQVGGAQALDLVAQPRRLLEVEVGGGLPHARLQVGDHRLEIVPDGGGGFLVTDAGEPAAGRDQHVVALVHRLQDIGDALAHALRRDAVLSIERGLLLAPAVGLGDGALHRAGHAVGVEDDAAVDVAGGAADGLDERGLAAQEALLIGVEDGDQRAFRNVEALAQQIDADQRVEGAQPQVADDLDALDRV